uniref:NTR domain-containing protein n=1 Tax=Gadus morhua TaxID=8049 RepID=A0A8C5FL43_GADMO
RGGERRQGHYVDTAPGKLCVCACARVCVCACACVYVRVCPQVLATDSNPGIEYEYWLPPDRYDLYHGRRSPLRQPHHTGYPPWAQPPSITTSTTSTTTTSRPPPVSCRRVRGRGERQRQYCTMDFVFRAKVMGKLYRGEETRYDVQVLHTYRNRYRLEHREFLWVSNVCDCPHLEPGRQYVLMVRRHINHERTLDRILLEEGSFATPYRPREDALLRETRCQGVRGSFC